MKYLKMLGPLAVAAAALMALAGTAVATVTSPAGTVYNGTLKASSTNTSIDGVVSVSCANTTIEWSVNNGATSGAVSNLTFSNCGSDTVVAINKGSISVSSAGTITSTGAQIAVQLHRFIFFPITTHCVFETNNTDIGDLTEGVAPAVLDIWSYPIPEITGFSTCSSDAEWTGSYTVSTPSTAITVD